MSTRVVVGAALVLVLGAAGARAGTWQCVSPGGSVVYTQSVPCSGDTRDVRAPMPERPVPATTRLLAPGRGSGAIEVYRGMPAADVRAALGGPNAVNRWGGAGDAEQWVYDWASGRAVYLYLRGGVVESWQAVGGL